jgi:hypothetical protein
VCDWLTGDLPKGIAVHWPLGVSVEDLTLHGDVLDAGRYRVRWAAGGAVTALHATLDPLTRSPGYGRSEAGRLLRVALDAKGPVTVATTFTAATTSARVEFIDAARVRVTLGGTPETVEIVLAPGIAPIQTTATAPPRSRPEGVLR